MRHPESLQRAIAHSPGGRIQRRSAPAPLSLPAPSRAPAPAEIGQPERPSGTGRLLVATAWLAAGTGTASLLMDVPAALDLVVAGVLLAIVGTAVSHPRTARRAVAALVGVLLLPALLLIALAVRLSGPGPVLVRQETPGREGPPAALRFRTTVTACRGESALMPGTQESRVGHVLRRLGLDELPRLIDVAGGGMLFEGTGHR